VRLTLRWAINGLSLPRDCLVGTSLSHRSDNCVKNHFYSKLRKALRRINRAIHHRHRKEYRDFKLPLLNRIVETTEERFKTQPSLDPSAVQQSLGTPGDTQSSHSDSSDWSRWEWERWSRSNDG
jgi:hypothetical protein